MNVGLLYFELFETLPKLRLYLGDMGDLPIVHIHRVVLHSLGIDILELLGLLDVPDLHLLIGRVESKIVVCLFSGLFQPILDRLEDCFVLLGCGDCFQDYLVLECLVLQMLEHRIQDLHHLFALQTISPAGCVEFALRLQGLLLDVVRELLKDAMNGSSELVLILDLADHFFGDLNYVRDGDGA